MPPLLAVVMSIALVVAASVSTPATPSTTVGSDSSVGRAHVDLGPQLPSQALYSWGSNDWGQLALGSSGQGTPTGVALPSQVAELPGMSFRSVAAGGAFTLGLTVNGQVYSWGTNATGSLGTGSPDDASSPQLVGVPGEVVAIAAGSSQSLALTVGGQLYAWGANLFGELGNGTTTGSDVPVPVTMPGGVTFIAIAAGGDHSLAVSATGQVYAWGANFYGQLGIGGTSPSNIPVAVPAPPGVTFTAVAAGTSHSLALTSTGEVYAWGFNASGQLGDGTTVDSPTMSAVAMPNGDVVSSIATGAAHSLALTTGGQVFVWGSNVFGQLDSALVDTLPVDSDVPVQPLGLPR